MNEPEWVTLGLGAWRPWGAVMRGAMRAFIKDAVALIHSRATQPVTVKTRVKNLSARPFRAQASYGRRLVRLGAQLMGEDGTMINRDYARAWLPGDIPPGGSADVAIEVPAPERPGRYALKFDLVSEGIDWFEKCGSPTTTKTLVVRNP